MPVVMGTKLKKVKVFIGKDGRVYEGDIAQAYNGSNHFGFRDPNTVPKEVRGNETPKA